jgi:hypothetical protein
MLKFENLDIESSEVSDELRWAVNTRLNVLG